MPSRSTYNDDETWWLFKSRTKNKHSQTSGLGVNSVLYCCLFISICLSTCRPRQNFVTRQKTLLVHRRYTSAHLSLLHPRPCSLWPRLRPNCIGSESSLQSDFSKRHFPSLISTKRVFQYHVQTLGSGDVKKPGSPYCRFYQQQGNNEANQNRNIVR